MLICFELYPRWVPLMRDIWTGPKTDLRGHSLKANNLAVLEHFSFVRAGRQDHFCRNENSFLIKTIQPDQ